MSISHSLHNNLFNLMTASNVEGLSYTFLYFSSDQMANRFDMFLSFMETGLANIWISAWNV